MSCWKRPPARHRARPQSISSWDGIGLVAGRTFSPRASRVESPSVMLDRAQIAASSVFRWPFADLPALSARSGAGSHIWGLSPAHQPPRRASSSPASAVRSVRLHHLHARTRHFSCLDRAIGRRSAEPEAAVFRVMALQDQRAGTHPQKAVEHDRIAARKFWMCPPPPAARNAGWQCGYQPAACRHPKPISRSAAATPPPAPVAPLRARAIPPKSPARIGAWRRAPRARSRMTMTVATVASQQGAIRRGPSPTAAG